MTTTPKQGEIEQSSRGGAFIAPPLFHALTAIGIILKFAVGIAEFHLKPCRTWAREENLTRFSFHLMGENMGKMDFACWSRCINGLKMKSNAFERVLVLALRFLGLLL
jgi:hypothetical protein